VGSDPPSSDRAEGGGCAAVCAHQHAFRQAGAHQRLLALPHGGDRQVQAPLPADAGCAPSGGARAPAACAAALAPCTARLGGRCADWLGAAPRSMPLRPPDSEGGNANASLHRPARPTRCWAASRRHRFINSHTQTLAHAHICLPPGRWARPTGCPCACP
jgi:hypothetical protein